MLLVLPGNERQTIHTLSYSTHWATTAPSFIYYKSQCARTEFKYEVPYVTECDVWFGMYGPTFRPDLLLPTSERLVFSQNTRVKFQCHRQILKRTAIDIGNDVSRSECFTFHSSINIKMLNCIQRDWQVCSSWRTAWIKGEDIYFQKWGKFVEQTQTADRFI